ncbi:prolyl oligopeptidase family serine peptidase [Chryseomicrobium palamuruense]|uniref:Prolyl oligopeptidase family serine peptidase n=1 Tax=Chryseomicrobium palamuruense TaxID=682973 RepID=A0ABV8UZH7_9BACL
MQFQDGRGIPVTLSFKEHSFAESATHILVIVRKRHQFLLTEHQERGFEFPGGKVEADEMPEEAAFREVYEETGVEISDLQFFAEYRVETETPFVKRVFLAKYLDERPFHAEHETKGRVWRTIREIEHQPNKSFYMTDAGMETMVSKLKQLFPEVHKHRIPSPHPDVKLEEVSYYSGPFIVKGWLASPREESNRSIVYLRGGINQIGKVRAARIAQIASQGFVVFAPHYRGSFGGEGKDEFVGEDRQDAYAAVDYLKTLGMKSIHLFAFSRGGIMALWTAVKRPEVTSLVTWGGVSSIYLTYKERVDMRRMMKRIYGGSPNTAKEAFEARDVLTQLHQISCPVRIIHGELDTNVGFEHATLLEEGLKREGKQVETQYLQKHHHFVPDPLNRQIVREALEWMKRQE